MINPRRWIGIATTTVLAALFLAACQTAAQPSAVPTKAVVATPTTARSPTAEPNYCLDCHTAKEALIANAKPEEKKESESEGVG